MRRHTVINPRGIFEELIDRLRGREQVMVRAGESLPLVVISYPGGNRALAEPLESAICRGYFLLSQDTRHAYTRILKRLPPMVVAVIRARNTCTCLGHHHPPGTESRIARRLAFDTGLRVGEIDLAIEAIRNWEPLPLASLDVETQATDFERPDLEEFRFRVALLAVFFHELEHLAFPDHDEREVRKRSTDFYAASLREFSSQKLGMNYGI